jgi:uroporphyrinogen decarboxylase
MMTPRERILAAIEHREPDQVPLDLGATPSSGISAIAYNNLVAHLGLDVGSAKVYDVVQQLAQPDDEVLDYFGVDVVDVGRAFNTADDDWYDYPLLGGSTGRYPRWFQPVRNESGAWIASAKDGTPIAEMPSTAVFFDQIYFPYQDGYPDTFDTLDDEMTKVLWAAFAHSPWDHVHEEGFWETLRERTLQLRHSTDRALMIVVGCNLFEWGTFLRRMDNFLMDLVAEPSNVERLLDALMERHLAGLAKVCEFVGDIVDVCRFGDDLGMDSGPFKPRHSILCDYVHKHSSMHTFLHSCGGIQPLIPDLIEAGFEILNPVQTVCKGMEANALKRDFGKEVTFWGGGCDTRKVLNRANPDEVYRHVSERLEICSPGGGFVFLAMYDALKAFNSK